MRTLARSITLLTALLAFVLQLPLLGAGVACDMESHAQPAGMERDAGASTAGADGHMAVMAGSASPSAPGVAVPVSVPEEAPCDHAPSAPACQSMTACASTIVAVAAPRLAAVSAVGALREIPTALVAPASLGVPPELPPPRA